MERGGQQRDREARGPSPACTPTQEMVLARPGSAEGTPASHSLAPCAVTPSWSVGGKPPVRHTAYYKSDETGLHMNINARQLGQHVQPCEANKRPD